MDNNQATQQLYQNLKKYRGAIGEVSKKTGRSRDWVRFVLQGKYQDTKVVDAATKLLAEYYKNETKVIRMAQEVGANCDRAQIVQNAMAYIG